MAEYINLEDGIGRVMGNRKLYRRMLKLFLEAKEPAELENAIAEGNSTAAGEAAHAIKGMTGNLGMRPLFDLSSRLTEECRNGTADPDTVAAFQEALRGTREEAAAAAEELED
ncbi:MAG: Hpt domain-containing protein [Oscillospiraceae bacterium]|jgi:HPt (histidine-containing phosphotransfer) domain-containing protein|nr:Hpt domain-containing protein [Oscillospiraceae bacterium]